MFGLTFDKLLVIAVIAVLLLGPERLPGYAAQFARLIRSLKRMAEGAKDRLRDEMGPDFDDVDWQKLDPRQYDPRRIIREALSDEFDSVVAKPVQNSAASQSTVVTADGPAPFDDEAT